MDNLLIKDSITVRISVVKDRLMHMDKDRAILMSIKDNLVRDNKHIPPPHMEVKDLVIAMPKELVRIKEAKLIVKVPIEDHQDHLQVTTKDNLVIPKLTIQEMPKVHQVQARNRAKVLNNSNNNNSNSNNNNNSKKAPVKVLHNRKRPLKRKIIMRFLVYLKQPLMRRSRRLTGS